MIFFDIGMTLMQGPISAAPSNPLAAMLGLDVDAQKDLRHQMMVTPLLSYQALAQFLADRYAVPLPAALEASEHVWKSQAGDDVQPIPGARELLQDFRNAGMRVGFISTIWFPYAQSFDRLFGDLAESEYRFMSYLLGREKPDPSIFQDAARAAGCEPSSCLMIGDSYDSDIRPAINLGWKTIWLLHRADKEAAFVNAVSAGTAPKPSLTIDSITKLDVKRCLDILSLS